MADEQYRHALESWRKEMDANLRRENDRLALAGLFWLQQGFNTFGSSRDCDIILPQPAPRIIGAFEFDGTNVTLSLDLGQFVELDGQITSTATAIKADDEPNPSLVRYQNLCMLVIRRSHGVGVRLWDNNRPERQSYPPRAWFPADEQYRVTGSYTPYPVPVKVKVPNTLGEVEEDLMHGYVSFGMLGRSHRLEASELADGRLYIQFRDRTNGAQTYPEGRYSYTDVPQEDGAVVIDFNRAFNPPSAFSKYSLSTFAGKSNRMKVAVEAGEIFQIVVKEEEGKVGDQAVSESGV